MAMELKFVAPKMEETFGKLTFAGVGEAETAYVNGRSRVTGRSYHLFSTRQRADDVVVTLPASVGEKHFGSRSAGGAYQCASYGRWQKYRGKRLYRL